MATAAGALERTIPFSAPEGVETTESAPSFESLLRRYAPALYQTAYRLAGNAADAEDLFQDAVIEGLRAFRGFEPGSHFDRWMRSIMSHTFIDRLRRLRRLPVAYLDDLTWLPAAADEDPEAHALQTEAHETVRTALAALPAEFRLPVVLVDLEGHSYEEVAAVMGCPVGTVRSRLHRGRLALRTRLAGVLRP